MCDHGDPLCCDHDMFPFTDFLPYQIRDPRVQHSNASQVKEESNLDSFEYKFFVADVSSDCLGYSYVKQFVSQSMIKI